MLFVKFEAASHYLSESEFCLDTLERKFPTETFQEMLQEEKRVKHAGGGGA